MKTHCSGIADIARDGRIERYKVMSFSRDVEKTHLILSYMPIRDKHNPTSFNGIVGNVVLQIKDMYPYISCIPHDVIINGTYLAANSPHKFLVIYIDGTGDIYCDIFGYKNGFNPGKNYAVVNYSKCKTIGKFLENPLARISHEAKEIHRFDSLLNSGCREEYLKSVKSKGTLIDTLNEYGNDQNQLQREKGDRQGRNVSTGSGVKVERSKLATKVGQIGDREISSYFKATIGRSPYNVSVGHQENTRVKG